jgi:hypothetical protein
MFGESGGAVQNQESGSVPSGRRVLGDQFGRQLVKKISSLHYLETIAGVTG